MSFRSVRSALGAIALGSACNRTPSVAEMAEGALPLAALSGVTLGMRASTLTSKRREAVAAPYSGFRESIGRYSVLYEVPGSVQDGQAPPPWERLASVIASEHLPSPDSTFRRWRGELTRIRSIRRSPARCFGVVTAIRADSGAVWSARGAEFFVFAHAIAPTDRDSARMWIEFGVAPNADHLRAIFGLTAEHACAIEIRAPAG